jgi:hypothetical protein
MRYFDHGTSENMALILYLLHFLHPPRPQSGFTTASILIVATVLLAGCSSKEAEKEAAEMLRQNTILQNTNRRLAAELAEQAAKTARLQMELVEKQGEIDRIVSSREGLAREVEYTKARIPTPSTKVEVVAYLAEAESEIEEARESADENGQQAFAHIDRLIAESKTELELDNFEKSYVLASQAKASIQAVQAETTTNGEAKKHTYTDFVSPVQLQVAKRSNIRNKPDRKADIVTSVNQGTTVTAIGYQEDWIKVILGNGNTGWINFPLLTVPE